MKPICALLLVTPLCSGCDGQAALLTLGAVIAQTGDSASPGFDHLQAMQLAVDEINAAGGVLNRELALVPEDDRNNPGRAVALASKLINVHHVSAIVGAITSPSTLAMQPITDAAHVVVISGSATSPTLTASSRYFWRTCTSDALQGQILAKRAIALNLMSTAIVYTPGSYGMGLANVFSTYYEAAGGTISFSQMIATGQSSYVSLLAQLYTYQPSAVLLVAYVVEGAQIIVDYNNHYSFENSFWLFPDSLQYSSFVEGVGAGSFTFAHEGTAQATPDSEAYVRFARAFHARYGAFPEGRSPQYYDAIYLLALAIERAGKVDGDAINSSLRFVADPPGAIVGPQEWALARSVLARRLEINYEGASGSVDLGDNGDVIAPYDIWRVENGQIVVINHSITQ
jgi:branched-chain amino acid transport system substrate-binding protein